MEQKRIYFEGLNALRFIAAFLVFILHVELFKCYYGYYFILWDSPLPLIGNYGVNIFFSLSGFLITYLLLVEQDLTNNINIRNFLLRRIYRIWPLYFIIILLGFFIIPTIKVIDIPNYSNFIKSNFFSKLLLYLLFLPNICLAYFKSIPYAGVLWSVGVEEQFYVLWPFLIKYFNNKIKLFFSVFFYCILIKLVLLIFLKYYPSNNNLIAIKDIVVMTRFECMTLGALGAYLMKQNFKIISFIQNEIIFNIVLCLSIIFPFVIPKSLEDLFHVISSFLATIIIINVVNKKFKILNLNSLNYLGKISYGIYMYHMISIGISINILKYCSFLSPDSLIWNISLYAFSFILTIVIASVSYKYIEVYFIRIKIKYAVVSSGDSFSKQT